MTIVSENIDVTEMVHPEIKFADISFGGGFGKDYFSGLSNSEVFDMIEKKQQIVDFLADYVEKSGTQGLVLGLSGGVDSALVASIAVQMPVKVHLVLLHEDRNRDDYKRARKYTEILMKENDNVVVWDEVDMFSEWTLNSTGIFAGIKDEYGLAAVNLRSRLRMVYLYYVANSTNSLVVGTGNYLEDNILGFFTKYGDGGVDIGPIQRLMKSEVYLMAFVNSVPIDILEAQPNDGLWEDDRNDSDQIGMTYREVEELLNDMKTDSEGNVVLSNTKNLKKLGMIMERFNKNVHKMKPIPTPDMELKYKTMFEV